MIQGILRFQTKLAEFAGYGVGGFGVWAMSHEQFRRLRSRHKITIQLHAGQHPPLITDSDSITTLNFGQEFGEMLGHIAAVDSIMISQYMLFAIGQMPLLFEK